VSVFVHLLELVEGQIGVTIVVVGVQAAHVLSQLELELGSASLCLFKLQFKELDLPLVIVDVAFCLHLDIVNILSEVVRNLGNLSKKSVLS
jgi:hypothetical protein